MCDFPPSVKRVQNTHSFPLNYNPIASIVSGAVCDPCHVEAGVDVALGVRRARLQDLGFRRLRLQEADESGETDKQIHPLSVIKD